MEVTLSFRTATVGDTDAILGLWDASGLGAGRARDTAEIAERLRYPDDFFVVGENDGVVVACAMGCYDGHRGWLKRVAVDSSLRSSGLGAALVGEVERRFLAAGVTKLRLSAWADNVRGTEFWERNGYVELPDIRYFTKDLLGEPDNDC